MLNKKASINVFIFIYISIDPGFGLWLHFQLPLDVTSAASGSWRPFLQTSFKGKRSTITKKQKKGVSTDSKGFTRLGGWEGRGEWEGTIWSSPWAVRQRVSPESCRPSTTFKGKRKKKQTKETRKCKTRQNNYVFQIGLRRTICQLIYIYVFIYI